MTGQQPRHLKVPRPHRHAIPGFALTLTILLTTGCATGTPAATGVADGDTSDDPRLQAIAGCMAQAGSPVDIASDGTLTAVNPSDADQGFEDALEQCTEEMPYAPTEAEILEIYARELENAACLEALGYDISPAPDADTYVASYNTADWWIPLMSVPENNRGRASVACPPQTDDR